jgi:hypothetical protein
MRKILGILIVILSLGLAASWYMHRARTRAMTSGQVFVHPQSPEDNPKPLPAPPVETPSPQQVTTDNVSQSTSSGPQQSVHTLRTSDSITRNPPNGAVFAGSGKFQLYRQGDITWRLNTETGDACILLATDAQWSKTRVFQHGCAAHTGS